LGARKSHIVEVEVKVTLVTKTVHWRITEFNV